MLYENITEFDTKLTADVVEWRPTQPSNETYILACGTYFLDKEINERRGCIYLFDFESNSKLNLLDKVEFSSSGILDLKWLNQNQMITIDSKNNIDLLEFDQEKNSMSYKSKLQLGNDCIGLTIDFLDQSNCYKILTSNTKGFMSISEFNNQNLNLSNEFKAHDYEIWSAYFDRFDNNLLYSGADDCVLKGWDLRLPDYKTAMKCSIFNGGVTYIMQPQRENTPLSGYCSNTVFCSSYDERIYVLDKRNMKRSVNESKKLNGGVWKMKLHPRKDLILCACMHTGAHLVNVHDLKSELYYDEHGLDNLVYGCDWKPTNEGNDDVIATCSFYNHSLKIWKLKNKEF